MTFSTSVYLRNLFHLLDAFCSSLKTIISVLSLDQLPLVFLLLNLAVENVDSIGFVVLICDQCAAGKSQKVSNLSLSFSRHSTAFGYLSLYVLQNLSHATSASFFEAAIYMLCIIGFACVC